MRKRHHHLSLFHCRCISPIDDHSYSLNISSPRALAPKTHTLFQKKKARRRKKKRLRTFHRSNFNRRRSNGRGRSRRSNGRRRTDRGGSCLRGGDHFFFSLCRTQKRKARVGNMKRSVFRLRKREREREREREKRRRLNEWVFSLFSFQERPHVFFFLLLFFDFSNFRIFLAPLSFLFLQSHTSTQTEPRARAFTRN